MRLLFEDRPYKLGDTIDLTVELHAKNDVRVREGRVDLVCEERWIQNFTVMAPAFPRSAATEPGGAQAAELPAPIVPKHIAEERREIYVHSGAILLQETRLSSGTTGRYEVGLEIQLTPPDHMSVSTVSWSLALAIDVAIARDIHKGYPLEVTLD